MAGRDRDEEGAVDELVEQSDLARRTGATELALGMRRETVERLRALAERFPDDPRHVQATAAGLYAIGQIATDAGLPAEAVEALDECEALYERLGEQGALDIAPLVNEVRARRARTLSSWGKGGSAVVDIDRAVQGQRKIVDELTESGADADADTARIDLARALAAAAVIQLRFGDPDLAVGAAESAVQIYLDQEESAGSPEGILVHVHSVAEALVVAELVNGAHGRAERSEKAGRQLRRMIPGSGGRSFVRDRVMAPGGPLVGELTPLSSTLAEALRRNGDRALADEVTLPAVDGAITVPSERCSPDLAPSVGIRLARAAVGIPDPADKLRVGLEAHWLLATAENKPMTLRSGFRYSGAAWIGALRACADVLEESAELTLALDLMSWAAGVAQRLTPFAYNPLTARQICDCFEHHARLLESSGDHVTARQAREATSQLRRLFPHDDA